jgi:hypothetical protein
MPEHNAVPRAISRRTLLGGLAAGLHLVLDLVVIDGVPQS